MRRVTHVFSCRLFRLLSCFLLATPLASAAQQHAVDLEGTHAIRAGTLEFRDGVMIDGVPVLRVLRWRGEKATLLHEIRPADLPILNEDCEGECEYVKSTPCRGKCVFGGVGTLAFDPTKNTAYLFADTGFGHNFTRVVVALDVQTGALRRLGTEFGSGFSDARTSPDGRYLAYLMGSTRGAMDGSSMLHIMDTQTGDVVSLTTRERRSRKLDSETLVDVNSYAWTGVSTITFKAEIRRAKADPDDLIEPTEHFERTEDLAKLFAAGEGKSGRQ